MMTNLMTISVKKASISSKPTTVYLSCPPLCGLFSIQQNANGGLSYKVKNVARGIENMRPSVHTTLNESTRLDENNVDMDQEQVELARTAYEYQFMISSVSSDLSRLRSAAKNF